MQQLHRIELISLLEKGGIIVRAKNEKRRGKKCSKRIRHLTIQRNTVKIVQPLKTLIPFLNT